MKDLLSNTASLLMPPAPAPTQQQTQPVRLEAIRGLFVFGKKIESGEVFEVQAMHAAEILVTGRAKFENESDRSKVFKQVEVY